MKINRKMIFFISLFAILFILVIFILFREENSTDTTDPELTRADTAAIITGEDDDVIFFLGIAGYELLRNDIKTLGLGFYDKFRTLEEKTIFDIESSERENNNKITIRGNYVVGTNRGENVVFSVKKNKYARINTSILTAPGDYDEKLLPSNSRRNIFISELPLYDDFYIIDYDLNNDKIFVQLYDIEHQDQAVSKIRESIEDTSNREDIEIIPLGSDNLDRFY